jgi:predicted CXXCH cytochrome family protein
MKFRYKIEKPGKTGVSESTYTDYDKASIRVGRGAGSDILLDSPLVSLTHAIFRIVDGSLSIEDLGSPGGIQVNRASVRQATLKAGDQVKLGDVEFKVFYEEPYWGILEERRVRDTLDEAERLQANMKRLDLVSSLPSLTFLSALLVLIVGSLFFVLPLTGSNLSSWSSGPISNNHKMIEHDCASCHASTPFQRVQDKQCIACHAMADHSPNLKSVMGRHPELDRSCASCHMEHNAYSERQHSLVARQSKLCVDCHGKLNQISPEANKPNITSFETHPEFFVSLQTRDPANPFKKVRLDEKPALVDGTPIKLNHALHLKPDLIGKKTNQPLQCINCHQLSPDLKTIQPIKFDKHCRECHPLGFDDQVQAEVPHGNADEVVNFVFAEYSKLFLELEQMQEGQRFIPGQKVEDVAKLNQAREQVQQETRDAETMLFTKTACYMCHEISENQNMQQGKSRFTVVKPQIPESWMPASTFSHGAHQQVKCESCHAGASESKETKDVLMPGIKLCRDCHAQVDVKGKVKSDCVECHSYHDSLEMPNEQRRDIKDMLMSMSNK